MAGRKSDFVLPTLDDLFSSQEERDEQKLSKIRDIPLELMEEALTRQMAEQQGLTEELKATDMMGWVRKMNNLKNSVQEIILTDCIYA